MAKRKSSSAVKKTKRRLVVFGLGSLAIIIVTTFTIGHYWVEIYDKYQEKKELKKIFIFKRWGIYYQNTGKINSFFICTCDIISLFVMEEL